MELCTCENHVIILPSLQYHYATCCLSWKHDRLPCVWVCVSVCLYMRVFVSVVSVFVCVPVSVCANICHDDCEMRLAHHCDTKISVLRSHSILQ